MSDWECATEEDLLQRLSDEIRRCKIIVHPDDAPFYAKIKAKYPTHTFGIKWDKLPIHHSFQAKSGMSREEHLVFVRAALRQFAEDANIPGNEIIYVIGDGVLTVVLEMPFNVLLTYSSSIFGLPQHTYVTKRDYSWCFRCSFEEHVDYGKAVE